MLWTMRSIKVTKVKNSEKKQFHIQCQTKNYQYGNRGIRERHPTMFKEETFSFTPIDDLVLSMPFEFIRNSKVGIWTKIERNWMKRLQKHLGHGCVVPVIMDIGGEAKKGHAFFTMGTPAMLKKGWMSRSICPGMSNCRHGSRNNNEHSVPYNANHLMSPTH